MPTFQYEALDEAGRPQKGKVTAANSDEAIARIHSQGYFPTSVREQKVKKSGRGSGGGGGAGSKKKKSAMDISISIGGVSQKQLTQFTRQLSTLQDAGLPLLRSISILEQQQKPGKLKDILQDIHEDISSGATLSDAMARHPKAFDRLYTKMIAAGEVGGVLELILQRLAEFMEKAARLRRRIIGAMIYPAVVLFVAAVILLGIMVFIVPKFQDIFADFEIELPAMTKMLISASAWLAGPLLEYLGGTAANPDQTIPGIVWIALSPIAIFFLLKLIRKTTAGKATTDWLLLHTPVVGNLVSKASIAKFTR
ncbi:MAG: type II secretion system F family protein, partial [Phycisphaeraceae bacterium]